MRSIFTYLFVLFVIYSKAQIPTPLIPVENPALIPFYHGVASGDPLSDRVILWTRITPDPGTDLSSTLEVNWQISEDLDFQNIANSGAFVTDSSRDWTVKVDATGLESHKNYYYRFMAPDGSHSVIGRTKTAPAPGEQIDNLRFVVASCSSVWLGYFNAYRRIAERRDLDAVIHVGDFIYNAMDTNEPIRVPDPPPVSPTSLEEWRERYNYYRLDPDQRAVMQQHPFIITWDNHDLQTDGNGPLNPNDLSVKAFYEWVPVREPLDHTIIYRKYSYGNLVDIIMMDMSYHRTLPPNSTNVNDPNRKILGDEQFAWLKDQLTHSTAKWRIIGSQRQFGQWNIVGLPSGGISMEQLVGENNSWSSYAADRDSLLGFLRTHNIRNNIFVSGDIHMTFAMDLVENPFDAAQYNTHNGGKSVAVEFQPGSITSENLDEITHQTLSHGFMDFLQNTSKTINKHHVFEDLTDHGYGILDIRDNATTGEFWYSKMLQPKTQEKFGAAFIDSSGDDHWQRHKLDAPSIPLLASGELAPDEESQFPTWIAAHYNRSQTLKVSPNPFNDLLLFYLDKDNISRLHVQVTDISGEMVLDHLEVENTGNGIYRLTDLLVLSPGMYFLTVQDQTQKWIAKIVKTE